MGRYYENKELPEDTNTHVSRSRKVTREELYEKVWSTPISHLAAEYGVSGSYLARVCTALAVPRPPAGYWQKKAVGKAAPRPPLPPAKPGDQLVWSADTPLARPVTPATRSSVSSPSRGRRRKDARHPILRGVEPHYRKTRKIDDYEFLRPYKLLLPDIVTSEAQLPRALDLANGIYDAFERKGYRVTFAPPDQPLFRAQIEEREVPEKDRKYGRYSCGRIWAPHRPTVAYIGEVPIGLALAEMSERVTLRYFKGKYVRDDSAVVKAARPHQLVHSWTTENDVPSGRFRLVAYAPRRDLEWSAIWQETPKRTLSSMFPRIVKELEAVVPDLKSKTAEAEAAAIRKQREWAEQQERWKREEDRRNADKALAQSREQLSEVIQKWSASMSIESFFREAEERLADVETDRRQALSSRLDLARSMMGTLDPLEFLERWVAPDERYRRQYPED